MLNKTTKKIGLYGGSFDPVHLAHIQLALTAKSYLELDELQIIPAANPWQRQPLKASPEHRLKMLEIALQDHKDWLKINPTEINRGGQTYTIDTLNALPKNNNYYWIMGSDQLENFCSWHKWQEIAQIVSLAVAKRPEHSIQAPSQLLEYLQGLNKNVVEIPFTQYEISATKIRQILGDYLINCDRENCQADDENINAMGTPCSETTIKSNKESALKQRLQNQISTPVLNYIIEHGLYC